MENERGAVAGDADRRKRIWVAVVGIAGIVVVLVFNSVPVVYRQASWPFTPYAVSTLSGCHAPAKGRLPWIYRTRKVVSLFAVPLQCFPPSQRKMVTDMRNLYADLGKI